MSWIPPLEMRTWIINVFSGNSDIFGAVAIFCIISMASYFRMNTLSMFLMLGIFVMMFSGYIGVSFLILFAIIGGLLAGYVLSRLFE